MRDLLSSLSTNLHIVVIAMLIVGLGLGMITSSTPGSGKAKRDQSVITLSTTPSVPPRQSQQAQGQPAQPQQTATPSAPTEPATGPQKGPTAPPATSSPAGPPEQMNTTAPSGPDATTTPPAKQPRQLKLPCAMCDDTSQCPDSCLTQNQTTLPWRRPQPPATICCGGKTVTIPYQPSFVICPTSCAGGASGN